jgi:hypothetical protein
MAGFFLRIARTSWHQTVRSKMRGHGPAHMMGQRKQDGPQIQSAIGSGGAAIANIAKRIKLAE